MIVIVKCDGSEPAHVSTTSMGTVRLPHDLLIDREAITRSEYLEATREEST